ncbi:MAG: glycosyltransferase [Planctomycetia bacterium]|nr:glycosyltransferase [Planctomycetia bacterium]
MSTSDSRVRIAFCITDLDPGGAERALVQLVTRLDPARWQPAVFCLAAEGALAGELRAAGVVVTCLGARRWTNVGAVWRLSRALRQFHPALVQTFLFHANLSGRIAGRVAGVRHIVSGIRVAERRSRWPLWIDRATNWMVHATVCVSQAVAEFSIREAGLSRRKIVVVPNGVDVSKFTAATPADLGLLGIPPGSETLLTIGRLDRQKGLATLVEAAARVIPKHPNVHFLLVGEGPERGPIENLIQQKGLGTRIHVAGWRSDVPDLLAAGSALVLPSLWEGMPNVVLEAMAAGLPVVATRVEGVAELVREGETGLTVPAESPQELAGAIEKLLGDPEAAWAMGHAGRERAAAEFTWETMTRRYEALYESLLPK